ncbi:sulfotransferase [Aquisalimonas sp.]|uniref:sulfotransferase n=1 Tax=Aquisalimonas sp. TaxID=1872621 RepID=UPI0025C69A97|nr:sulfotransferase [Aquisalimonas sp.]
MELLLAEHSLDEGCALQWQRCVDSAAAAFAAMPRERWLEVAYEDFVRAPEAEVGRVLAFLGIEASALQRREAATPHGPWPLRLCRGQIRTNRMPRWSWVGGVVRNSPR